ncbi:MAG: PucR family transcriptional regulator ligand-binding domain-containing protein [Clostridiaceae bacterium]|nr:PucR family transcriptional regulator ligand-binding domain-containing protein [Clostridiaceae bacterium]
MNCEDLMNMIQIKDGIKLVAGETGVHRNIRWIYFADCIQCLDENFDISELIHGEELVIVTNVSLTNDDNKIIQLIDAMYKKNIAAFVINEGQISQKIIAYCNELQLPLFELSLQLHLIDFSQIVCRILVEEESNMNSIERILASILYSEHINKSEIMEQANYLDVSLSGKQRLTVFQIAEMKTQKQEHKEEGYLIEVSQNISKIVRREFRNYGLRNIMMYSQIEFVAAMLPAELFSKDLLSNIIRRIMEKAQSMYKVVIYAGVGTPYEYIEQFKYSYQEAKNAITMASLVRNDDNIYYYDDLGIYSLIMQISNGKFLDDYLDSKLGKLIDADNIQDGDLCSTLETYLNNNCNANAAAEELYIHRNTMRYRMEKIKKIINEDVSDLSTAMELKLAFAIRRYRNTDT